MNIVCEPQRNMMVMYVRKYTGNKKKKTKRLIAQHKESNNLYSRGKKISI